MCGEGVAFLDEIEPLDAGTVGGGKFLVSVPQTAGFRQRVTHLLEACDDVLPLHGGVCDALLDTFQFCDQLIDALLDLCWVAATECFVDQLDSFFKLFG